MKVRISRIAAATVAVRTSPNIGEIYKFQGCFRMVKAGIYLLRDITKTSVIVTNIFAKIVNHI
jgi:hypothetical protein